MKTTTVPAQVTTVEDRITSNFTLLQLVLLMLPIFVDFVVYAILPMPFRLSAIKVGLAILLTSTCWSLSVRYKDKVVLKWIVMISKYYFRPRYYVNKKLALDSYKLECEDLGIKEKLEQKPNFVSRKVSNLEELRATDLLLDETIKVVFVAGRKARLNVHAIETK